MRKIFKSTKAHWHDGTRPTRPTRPTMTREPRNLAHVFLALHLFQVCLYLAFSVSPFHTHFFALVFHLFFLSAILNILTALSVSFSMCSVAAILLNET